MGQRQGGLDSRLEEGGHATVSLAMASAGAVYELERDRMEGLQLPQG